MCIRDSSSGLTSCHCCQANYFIHIKHHPCKEKCVLQTYEMKVLRKTATGLSNEIRNDRITEDVKTANVSLDSIQNKINEMKISL